MDARLRDSGTAGNRSSAPATPASPLHRPISVVKLALLRRPPPHVPLPFVLFLKRSSDASDAFTKGIPRDRTAKREWSSELDLTHPAAPLPPLLMLLLPPPPPPPPLLLLLLLLLNP